MARRTSHAAFTVIATWNTKRRQAELYQAAALPFGVAAGVFGFNRCSRAIDHIAAELFDIVTANYADDYPQVEATATAPSADATFVDLLELLGWKVKIVPGGRVFKHQFEALGVEFDFQSLSRDSARSAEHSGTEAIHRR